MARKLTGEHLERVRAAAERETGRRKKAPERQKEYVQESIRQAEWQIAQLKGKIAELQGLLKTLEAKEGQESEPVALERSAVIPDAWLKEDREPLRMWEAALLEGRPANFEEVYRRWVGERSPGKAAWLPGDFEYDIQQLARGSEEPRLQEVRRQHYPGWESEDFQALGELLGIQELPEKTAVETEDGEALAALIEGRIMRLEDLAQDAGDFEYQLRHDLTSFLAAQGMPEGEESFDDRVSRSLTTGHSRNLQTVGFMGQTIATVEPSYEDRGVGTFHFDGTAMKEAIRGFLVEQGIAYGGAK